MEGVHFLAGRARAQKHSKVDYKSVLQSKKKIRDLYVCSEQPLAVALAANSP